MIKFNGWYQNSIDDNLSSPTADITWMEKNKITTADCDTLYISSSKVNDPKFPGIVQKCSDIGVKLGIAYSSSTEIDNMIAYNKRQTVPAKMLQWGVTEYEDYNTGDQAYYAKLLKDNSAKLLSAGLLRGAYQGWSTQYSNIVKYTDFLLLHAYRTSAQMAAPDDAYKYCKGRLASYAAEAKLQGKIYPISIIYSCEPSFGYDYFKTHTWMSAHTRFLSSYNSLATATMKSNLIINGAYYFVSKYGKQIMP